MCVSFREKHAQMIRQLHVFATVVNKIVERFPHAVRHIALVNTAFTCDTLLENVQWRIEDPGVDQEVYQNSVIFLYTESDYTYYIIETN